MWPHPHSMDTSEDSVSIKLAGSMSHNTTLEPVCDITSQKVSLKRGLILAISKLLNMLYIMLNFMHHFLRLPYQLGIKLVAHPKPLLSCLIVLVTLAPKVRYPASLLTLKSSEGFTTKHSVKECPLTVGLVLFDAEFSKSYFVGYTKKKSSRPNYYEQMPNNKKGKSPSSLWIFI